MGIVSLTALLAGVFPEFESEEEAMLLRSQGPELL